MIISPRPSPRYSYCKRRWLWWRTGNEATPDPPISFCTSRGSSYKRNTQQNRGGVAGPAGPALAGPLFSGALVSFSDCRDSVRTRRFGQVSHASSPLPCVYAFLVIVPALLPADQQPGAARLDCIGTTHFDSTSGIYCRGTLPVVDRTASAPTHFDSTSSFYCRTLSVVDLPSSLHMHE